jgi:hypothetical protein
MNAFWTIWLFGLVPLSFAAAEAYAIMHGRATLSQYVWKLSKVFPLFPWLAGVLTGGLAVHFWWSGCV